MPTQTQTAEEAQPTARPAHSVSAVPARQSTPCGAVERVRPVRTENEKRLRHAYLYLRFFPLLLQVSLLLVGWSFHELIRIRSVPALLEMIQPIGFVMGTVGWRSIAQETVRLGGGKHQKVSGLVAIGWLWLTLGQGLPGAYKRGEAVPLVLIIAVLLLFTSVGSLVELSKWRERRKQTINARALDSRR